ncbi:Leucine-rich repeat, ribonuclease inhibitor subtype [Plasmopara halstedii]|uniref:Leucine-rich repeat, ribonuclease inhibitor subtype n=1 Tax=Plasmopara halstedii TaxID=4781 RepID=A0A0P1B490_PLAHL|nr:Leucine-rich repeat, ribonuclease inhibitor subtype [Plasmopara halstedii]CEG49166.1 Leucine-rich repeat, ribonuclease inhibitor subtype [Plasmopara halstedii]|eukprot:XP_024585535.1 Leucine-rich repeat, ribonuclease inhibitor subtype [Plasmopara halstedii]
MSLIELSIAAVALSTPVHQILDYVEFFPIAIRQQLFYKLSNLRLREMEVAWEAAAHQELPESREGYDPMAGDKFLFDRELQRVWDHRLSEKGLSCELNPTENALVAIEQRRNSRNVFWEHQFRTLLKLRTPPNKAVHGDILIKYQRLFVDVVEVLKVHGREICEYNVKLILALRQLRRLEVHHPEQQTTCWRSLTTVMRNCSRLAEVCFFHGKLSVDQIIQIRNTLMRPNLAGKLECSRIATLELISVKIRLEGFRQLLKVIADIPHLTQLRLSNTIATFDTKLLIDAAFRASGLQRLFLEHNELEDDAFIGLSKVRNTLPLRHLRLSDNDLSSITARAICSASMDGVMNLERLELANNVQIGDSGIHALTPMLASPGVGPAAVLIHLDVRGCNFGLEGATNLMLALSQNRTVKYLNIAQNFLDTGFGDVLADFLITNESVTQLQANDVGLGLAGVSARLLTALETNTTLISLSMGANRLRNAGAAAILRSLVKRARTKPFTLVDLSGNLLTFRGLEMIADILKAAGRNNAVHTTSPKKNRTNDQDVFRKRHRTSSIDANSNLLCNYSKPIEEFCLLNNIFIKNDENVGGSATLVDSIRRFVGQLKSNEWAGQHQVYDDEV